MKTKFFEYNLKKLEKIIVNDIKSKNRSFDNVFTIKGIPSCFIATILDDDG